MTDNKDRPVMVQTIVPDSDRLKLLMDYTKFHIGLYATVITILLALASFGSGDVPAFYHRPVMITLVAILLAGLAGGIVASHIPEQTNFDDFWNGRVGLWDWPMLPTKWVARFEHVAFWLGVVNACAAVAMGSDYPLASQPDSPPGGGANQ